MASEIDTSAEAVEQLAAHITGGQHEAWEIVCASTLRALAAANAQLERERDEIAKVLHERILHWGDAIAQRNAATAALAKAEGERDSMPRYRHVKRGTIYEIVLRCCLQLDGEHDMSPMVVYRDVADGSLWTRRQSEFFDGRFEALTPAPEAPKDGE